MFSCVVLSFYSFPTSIHASHYYLYTHNNKTIKSPTLTSIVKAATLATYIISLPDYLITSLTSPIKYATFIFNPFISVINHHCYQDGNHEVIFNSPFFYLLLHSKCLSALPPFLWWHFSLPSAAFLPRSWPPRPSAVDSPPTSLHAQGCIQFHTDATFLIILFLFSVFPEIVLLFSNNRNNAY